MLPLATKSSFETRSQIPTGRWAGRQAGGPSRLERRDHTRRMSAVILTHRPSGRCRRPLARMVIAADCQAFRPAREVRVDLYEIAARINVWSHPIERVVDAASCQQLGL